MQQITLVDSPPPLTEAAGYVLASLVQMRFKMALHRLVTTSKNERYEFS